MPLTGPVRLASRHESWGVGNHPQRTSSPQITHGEPQGDQPVVLPAGSSVHVPSRHLSSQVACCEGQSVGPARSTARRSRRGPMVKGGSGGNKRPKGAPKRPLTMGGRGRRQATNGSREGYTHTAAQRRWANSECRRLLKSPCTLHSQQALSANHRPDRRHQEPPQRGSGCLDIAPSRLTGLCARCSGGHSVWRGALFPRRVVPI